MDRVTSAFLLGCLALGIPDLYAYQQTDPQMIGDTPTRPNEDISAGGDQPVSCASLARAGLLLANRGVWRDASGAPMRMVDESYVDEIFTPQFPALPEENCANKMCRQFSLLATVMTNNSLPPEQNSCTNETIGLLRVLGVPDGSIVGMGWLGKYLMVVPKLGIVVAAMANHRANLACPNASDRGGGWSTEEGLILSQIWKAISPALDIAEAQERARPAAPETSATEVRTTDQVKLQQTVPRKVNSDISGACYCYCGFYQAIGKCYEVPAGENGTVTCPQRVHAPAADLTADCPSVSMLYDCFDRPSQCPTVVPEFANHNLVSWSASCPKTSQAFSSVQTCTYRPASFTSCSFVPGKPCDYSPFFPN